MLSCIIASIIRKIESSNGYHIQMYNLHEINKYMHFLNNLNPKLSKGH